LKKLAFLIVLVVAFALMGGVALAETPHGPFDTNTAVCGACHRAHTSTAEYLLATPRVTTLCIGCHDGTGADTDVINGVYVVGGTETGPSGTGYNHADWGAQASPLLGGGFNQILAGVGASNTTSRHMQPTAIDVAKTTFPIQWGVGTTGPGASKLFLDCVDCHMPHRSPNYRMLRVKPTGYNGANLSVPEVTGRIVSSVGAYNPVSMPGRRYTEDSGMFNYTITATQSISKWCGTGCHDYYYRSAVRNDNGHIVTGASPSMQTRTVETYTANTTSIHVPDASLVPVGKRIRISGQWLNVTVSNTGTDILTVNPALTVSGTLFAGAVISIEGAGMEVYYDFNGDQVADPGFMHAIDVDLAYWPRNLGTSATKQNLAPNLGTSPNRRYANTMPVADTGATPGAYDESDSLTCLTCHRAHGTDAPMASGAALPARQLGGQGVASVNAPSGATVATNGSMLLRLENRAICQQCHEMPTGF